MLRLKRLFIPLLLGTVYVVIEYLVKDEQKPIHIYILNTGLLAVVAFIFQYYTQKEKKEGFFKYVISTLYSVSVIDPPSQLIAKRIKTTWIDQYLRAARTDVQGFKVEFSHAELNDISIEARKHSAIKSLIEDSPVYQGYHSLSEELDFKNPRILILGSIGSGKSILMLQLVEYYVKMILGERGDRRTKVPVVLNLSTFRHDGDAGKETKKSVAEKFEGWLIDQLKLKYGIVPADTEKLIRKDKLILFLDGLDDLDDDDLAGLNEKEKQNLLAKTKDRINEVINLFNGFINNLDKVNASQNTRTSFSYVLTMRDTTFDMIVNVPGVKEVISVCPLSLNSIEEVLKLQEDEQEEKALDLDFYRPVLLDLIMTPSEEQAKSEYEKKFIAEHSSFALEMAKNPYLLNVMRKTAKMKRFKELDELEDWFLEKDKFKERLFNDYIDLKLNEKIYLKNQDHALNQEAGNHIRWLSNMAEWSTGSEFLVEDLQPNDLLPLSKNEKWKQPELWLYWTLYTGAITFFMILVVALPVGVSLFYEWNAYEGMNCLENLKTNWVIDGVSCEPGIRMGLSAFLWSTLTLIITIPLAFTFGSMGGRKATIKIPAALHKLRKYIPGFITNAFEVGGIRFAFGLSIALAITRFILIKHSYNDETGMSFGNDAAFANLSFTFLACFVLFVYFAGKNLLKEDLYKVNDKDDYALDTSRAIKAVLAGIGVTLLFLASAVIQYLIGGNWESTGVIIGRSLAFGGMLTICLPLLFSFKPVSDRRIKVSPNHGIRKHIENSVISFMILFIIGTALLYIVYRLNVNPVSGVVNAITGVSFGVLALMYGLLSVFRHYALRVVVSIFPKKKNLFPFQINRFLQQMEKMGFVYRVGGRYLFEHSLLRAHFKKINKRINSDPEDEQNEN